MKKWKLFQHHWSTWGKQSRCTHTPSDLKRFLQVRYDNIHAICATDTPRINLVITHFFLAVHFTLQIPKQQHLSGACTEIIEYRKKWELQKVNENEGNACQFAFYLNCLLFFVLTKFKHQSNVTTVKSALTDVNYDIGDISQFGLLTLKFLCTDILFAPHDRVTHLMDQPLSGPAANRECQKQPIRFKLHGHSRTLGLAGHPSGCEICFVACQSKTTKFYLISECLTYIFFN